MKLSPRIGILRTARLPTQLCCVLLWLIVGAALEVLGRTLRSELMDAAALFVLSIMVGITWLLHHRTPQTKFSGGIIQLAEEWHSRGMPGLCVIIHDFSMGDPFESQVYSEPDYKELGRGRFLHIFKDRQEEDEASFDPSDLTRQPITLIGV